MLAAIGWPASELTHYNIAKKMGLQELLAEGGKAPSVLNGGLDNFYILVGLGFFFAIGSVIEIQQLLRSDKPKVLENFYNLWEEDDFDEPGDYAFDPLNFKELLCEEPGDRVKVQKIEVFNGRLSMLATVGYAIQESVTGLPVVSETPYFFKPFWEVFS